MAHFPQGSLLTTVPDSGGVSLSKRMKMKDDVDLLIKSGKNMFKSQKITKMLLITKEETSLKSHLFCHVKA